MMEVQYSLFREAGKLLQVAYDTAEAALLEAQAAGVSGRDLFVLCEEACKCEVPSLEYNEELFFEITLEQLRMNAYSRQLSYYVDGPTIQLYDSRLVHIRP